MPILVFFITANTNNESQQIQMVIQDIYEQIFCFCILMLVVYMTKVYDYVKEVNKCAKSLNLKKGIYLKVEKCP